MSRLLELYVHIPFCVRKCDYCDFLSFPSAGEQQAGYMEALRREIMGAGDFQDCHVGSVFFGGGTPSVPEAGRLAEILELLKQKFSFEPEAEITLEANPGTLSSDKLDVYRNAGFNRLSLGCQSVHDRELRQLGRIHTFREFQESFFLARSCGFTNINVDLMSGIPGQSLESYEASLRTVAEMEPEHISAYSLIIEPGTPFASRSLDLPDEETERNMYGRTGEILGEYGYGQYEISNYAKPGYECRHNIGYWKRTEYLGFGAGAASLLENRRFTNTSDMERYLADSGQPWKIRENIEQLSEQDVMEEFMFLGLRMKEGISEEEFLRQFGKAVDEVYRPVIRKYLDLSLLWRKNGRIGLTRAGVSVSNVIMADFLLG